MSSGGGTIVSYITCAHRVRRVLVVGQIVEDGRLAAAPRAHEQYERFREDLRIAKVTIAEIAILVQRFERFDRVVVDALQVAQDHVGRFLQRFLARRRIIVDVEQFVDVRSISKVRWNFVLLYGTRQDRQIEEWGIKQAKIMSHQQCA